jgi:hypothetical protein
MDRHRIWPALLVPVALSPPAFAGWLSHSFGVVAVVEVVMHDG